MAFLRFTRDKRGYEHFALVQPTTRRGKSASRVLYWFRTPPDIKLGREPFDAEVRRELEARYPDVTFDWRKILETPIPSADADKWRERRRLERAERAARHAMEREDEEQNGAESSEAPAHVIEAAAEASPSMATDVEVTPDPAVTSSETPTAPISESETRRRKRRRRRGRRGKPATQTPE